MCVCMCVCARACVLSRVHQVCLIETLQTVAYQSPLVLEILQARTLERAALPPAGDLPDPGTEATSALTDEFFTTGVTQESPGSCIGENRIFFNNTEILQKSS